MFEQRQQFPRQPTLLPSIGRAYHARPAIRKRPIHGVRDADRSLRLAFDDQSSSCGRRNVLRRVLSRYSGQRSKRAELSEAYFQQHPGWVSASLSCEVCGGSRPCDRSAAARHRILLDCMARPVATDATGRRCFHEVSSRTCGCERLIVAPPSRRWSHRRDADAPRRQLHQH